MNQVKSEAPQEYRATKTAPKYQFSSEEEILDYAAQLVKKRIIGTEAMTDPDTMRRYFDFRLSRKEYELFGAVFMDNRHRVLQVKELFRGTIDGASVFPREVVKEALKVNAAAVIFYHNHPSGMSIPSQSDIQITRRLKDALALVDIKILDHMVVGETITSLAESGHI